MRFGLIRVATRISPPCVRAATRFSSASMVRHPNATLVRWSFGTVQLVPISSKIRNRLAAESNERGEAEKRQETETIGAGRHEHGRGHGRIDPQPIECD